MSFGDRDNPYGQPGYPHQAPQGVPPQYGHPQQVAPQYQNGYGYPQQLSRPAPYSSNSAPATPGGIPEPAHWGLRVGADLLDTLVIIGPMYALGCIDLVTASEPDTAEPGILPTVLA
ncbi:hypothetical protein ACFYZT_33160 [Streptomyces sp. NPDC001591]|uniref:hypothetical protein n=1 Tax=Streptomyces sp. NPDC001591 TaxID=3364589 RepID=UPI0036B8A658